MRHVHPNLMRAAGAHMDTCLSGAARRSERTSHKSIEHILRHVGVWVNEVCNHDVRISPSTGPQATETIECGQLVIEPWLDDPIPDYDRGL